MNICICSLSTGKYEAYYIRKKDKDVYGIKKFIEKIVLFINMIFKIE